MLPLDFHPPRRKTVINLTLYPKFDSSSDFQRISHEEITWNHWNKTEKIHLIDGGDWFIMLVTILGCWCTLTCYWLQHLSPTSTKPKILGGFNELLLLFPNKRFLVIYHPWIIFNQNLPFSSKSESSEVLSESWNDESDESDVNESVSDQFFSSLTEIFSLGLSPLPNSAYPVQQ